MTFINRPTGRRTAGAGTARARALSAGIFLACIIAAPAAAGEAFIDSFNGTWTGEGEVLRDEDGSTRSIACRVENTREANTAKTAGECRAMVIFRREIGSEITLRPDGSFTGTYIGADNGPATLEGSLDGDVLELRMTYAKPVYGDNEAVMRITSPAGGSYSVSVYDHVDDPDALERVSRIEFTRQD